MSELHAILEVQRLDNSLDQLRYRHENLVERDQIATANTELVTLTDATKNTEASRDDLRRRQSGLETDAADFEEKANGLDGRLYGGMVTSPKEATAITVEIESLRARQSGLEDQSIELLVEIEPLDELMVQAEAARGEIEARRTAASNALSEAVANLDNEIEAQLSARESATAEVGRELLKNANHLRTRRGRRVRPGPRWGLPGGDVGGRTRPMEAPARGHARALCRLWAPGRQARLVLCSFGSRGFRSPRF